MSKLETLNRWVDDVVRLTQPDNVHWCDGSEAEYDALVEKMLASGDLIELNPRTHPNCYLHHSNVSDVARVEHLTFICTQNKEDAGPNNNWMDPVEAHAKIDALFAGSMKGRTMYVIPYCMGPIGSPLSRCGVEITDSPYVVANMRIMTRMGEAALARIERDGKIRERSALDRRARSAQTIYFALPGRTHDQVDRLGLWRQRAARQEMPRAAHRFLSGAARRLARRAHADRRHPESERRDALYRGGVSVCMRKDQSRDADST